MSYEVAVACDVALGEAIRNDPDYSVIDIDPEAVKAVLEDFAEPTDTENRPELLVIACHHDSIQARAQADSHIAGSFTPARQSKIDAAIVSVAVAGNPHNLRFPNPDAFVDTVTKAIKAGDTLDQATAALTEIAEVEPFTAAESIQETTIHELSHAADDLDNAAKLEAISYHMQQSAAKLGAFVVTGGVTLAGLNSLDSLADTISNQYVTGVSQGLIACLGGYIATRLTTKSAYQRYYDAPDEKRARLMETTAYQYPQIITVR